MQTAVRILSESEKEENEEEESDEDEFDLKFPQEYHGKNVKQAK